MIHVFNFLIFFSLTIIIVKGHGNIELLSRSTPPLLEGFGPVFWPPAPRISSTLNCLLPYE